MTLSKQLFAFLSILILGLFVSLLSVAMNNAQKSLDDQLLWQARNTVAVLGKSISPLVAEGDPVLVERTLAGIWDSGYYSELTLSVNGQIQFQRQNTTPPQQIPQWFVNHLPLKVAPESQVLTSGWRQIGVISLSPNPGPAYLQMYQTFKNALIVLCVGIVFSISIGALFLYVILKPLRAITTQARHISEQDFMVIENIPRTKDLRIVVMAMNRMSLHLKKLFDGHIKTSDHLRESAFKESITGLGNQRFFDAQLNTQLFSPQAEPGVLVGIQLAKFDAFVDAHGSKQTERLLTEVTHRLCQTLVGYQGVQQFYLSSGRFLCIIPKQGIRICEQLGYELVLMLTQVHADQLVAQHSVGHVGLTTFKPGDAVDATVTKMELALASAQLKDENAFYTLEESVPSSAGRSEAEWITCLDEAISHEGIELVRQSIEMYRHPQLTFYEVFARIWDKDGTLLPASWFVPMAEKLEKMVSIDLIMLDKMLDHLETDAIGNLYALNMSPQFITDESAQRQVFQRLSRAPKAAKRIIFEFPEYTVSQHVEEAKQFFKALKQLGCWLAVDHYGKTFTQMAYLYQFPVDMLKIDGTFAHNLSDNAQVQFYVRTLINIAHNLGKEVVAENVESDATAESFNALGVDGMQGFNIGYPESFINKDTA